MILSREQLNPQRVERNGKMYHRTFNCRKTTIKQLTAVAEGENIDIFFNDIAHDVYGEVLPEHSCMYMLEEHYYGDELGLFLEIDHALCDKYLEILKSEGYPVEELDVIDCPIFVNCEKLYFDKNKKTKDKYRKTNIAFSY